MSVKQSSGPRSITPGASEAKSPSHPNHVSTLDSGTLFAGSKEVIIRHGGDVYHLRLTRQNRLILTK